MSYSRWGSSVWYTFYNVSGKFTVCGIADFAREELNNLEGCLCRVKTEAETKWWRPVTIEELKELKEYMECFIEDYDADNRQKRVR